MLAKLAGAALVTAFVAAPACAQTVEYRFTGTLTPTVLSGGVQIFNRVPTGWENAQIAGTLWLDAVTAPAVPPGPVPAYSANGDNTGAWLRIELTNPDGTTFSSRLDDAIESTGLLTLVNDKFQPTGGDRLATHTDAFIDLPGPRATAELQLESVAVAGGSTLIRQGVTPGISVIDVSQADGSRYGYVSYSDGSYVDGLLSGYGYYFTVDTFTQTSPVPEPVTAWLWITGITALAATSGRRLRP